MKQKYLQLKKLYIKKKGGSDKEVPEVTEVINKENIDKEVIDKEVIDKEVEEEVVVPEEEEVPEKVIDIEVIKKLLKEKDLTLTKLENIKYKIETQDLEKDEKQILKDFIDQNKKIIENTNKLDKEISKLNEKQGYTKKPIFIKRDDEMVKKN